MDCRLLRPWVFPGKSTGVGCHCLLRAISQYPHEHAHGPTCCKRLKRAGGGGKALLLLTPPGPRLPHWRPGPSSWASCGPSVPHGLCTCHALPWRLGLHVRVASSPLLTPFSRSGSHQASLDLAVPLAHRPLLFFAGHCPLTFCRCLSVMILLPLLPPLDCELGESRDLHF